MRVLHVCKTDGIGGAERHLLALLPALSRAGVAVQICVAGAGNFHLFTDRLRSEGFEAAVVNAGPDLNPLLFGALRREIRRSKADIVHTHLIHADFHGQLAAATLGMPRISSIHGTHGFYRRMPYRAAAALAGHLAHRTIAISHYVRDFLTELRIARPNDIRVVPYGIEASRWSPQSGERQRAREQHGISDDDVVVGVASRLVPHKGHETLLEAVGQAIQQDPRIRLLVAGAGPLRQELEVVAAGLPPGSVRFLGFVSDVKEFLSACDVFVFPSLPQWGEGFGLAALEAMAVGLPVVASDTGPLPEVVADRESGLLVPPGASDDLARALVRLSRDTELRVSLGRRARERALGFSLAEMARGTLAVYEELVRTRSSSS